VPIQAVEAQRLYQQIAQQLRQLISSGEFPPGSRLPAERELASLQKYAERKEKAWQHQLQRQEQKSNDEMAANLHRQNTAATPWKHSS